MADTAFLEITGRRTIPLPRRGGRLVFSELGVAGCPSCGWRGVPTVLGHVRQEDCPVCDAEDYAALGRADGKAPGRNEPCPCGSGKKSKKCCWR